MTLCPLLNTVVQHNSGFHQATTGCKCTGGELLFDIIGPSHSFLFIYVGSGLRKGNRVPQGLCFDVVSLKETEQYQNLLVTNTALINIELEGHKWYRSWYLSSHKLVKEWSWHPTLSRCHINFLTPPPFLGEKYCKEKLIPDHGFTGMSRNSPEAKAALGGGPTSPPLVWLMVGGSVWADNGWSCSSLGRRSYTDSVVNDEPEKRNYTMNFTKPRKDL